MKEIVATQLEIVRAAWPCLRPGGALVYATCSRRPREDEEIVHHVLKEFHDAALEDPAGLAAGGDATLRLWPQTHDSAGFFAAKLRKAGDGGGAAAATDADEDVADAARDYLRDAWGVTSLVGPASSRLVAAARTSGSRRPRRPSQKTSGTSARARSSSRPSRSAAGPCPSGRRSGRAACARRTSSTTLGGARRRRAARVARRRVGAGVPAGRRRRRGPAVRGTRGPRPWRTAGARSDSPRVEGRPPEEPLPAQRVRRDLAFCAFVFVLLIIEAKNEPILTCLCAHPTTCPAGAGRGSRVSRQAPQSPLCTGARHPARAPRRLGSVSTSGRLHGLAENRGGRGAGAFVKRPLRRRARARRDLSPPRPTAAERASSDGAAMRGSKSSGQLTRV